MKYLVGLPITTFGLLVPGWISANCREDLHAPAFIAGLLIGVAVATIGLLICAGRPEQ